MVMKYTAAVREADKQPITFPANIVRLRPSVAAAMAAAATRSQDEWDRECRGSESIGRSSKRPCSGIDGAGSGGIPVGMTYVNNVFAHKALL
jgi:hypothetical protein